MAVYIGKREYRLGGMIMSHMLADTIEELHQMAAWLGIEKHFQDKPGKPHYDLCKLKKRLAIKLGAIEVDDRQLVLLCKNKLKTQ